MRGFTNSQYPFPGYQFQYIVCMEAEWTQKQDFIMMLIILMPQLYPLPQTKPNQVMGMELWIFNLLKPVQSKSSQTFSL